VAEPETGGCTAGHELPGRPSLQLAVTEKTFFPAKNRTVTAAEGAISMKRYFSANLPLLYADFAKKELYLVTAK